MRMKEWLKIYNNNRYGIQRAITQLNRTLNKALARKEHNEAYVHIRCLFILYVSWLEVSMYCILHSANKLSSDERQTIICLNKEIDKWDKIVDICFKKYYLSTRQRIFSKVNLGPTTFYRYQELHNLINVHISSYISIRNRLAHGQWSIAVNSKGTGKSQELTTNIMTLTKKDIMLIKTILNNFVNLITALCCSKTVFENNYDTFIHKIDLGKTQIEERYQWTIDHLKKSQIRKESLGYF